MLKRIISFLVLSMYLHGMSGYAMSIHTCSITGFESIHTGYGLADPCNMDESDCDNTSTHFERGDCCDVQKTIVNVDDDSNVSYFKTSFTNQLIFANVSNTFFIETNSTFQFYTGLNTIRPPELSIICTYKI